MHAGADRILQLQLATDNVGATIETYQTLCATEIAMEACKEALALYEYQHAYRMSHSSAGPRQAHQHSSQRFRARSSSVVSVAGCSFIILI